MGTHLVSRHHALRGAVEGFIASIYQTNYGARIEQFPPTLIAAVHGDDVRCAASLRFSEDGFFSESYLDDPLEVLVAQNARRSIAREKMFEVGSLSSCSPAEAPRFINQIVSLGEGAGFECAIFTATERLRRLLGRIGLPLVRLGLADPGRIERPQAWGSYYLTRPEVFAVTRDAVADMRHGAMLEEAHA